MTRASALLLSLSLLACGGKQVTETTEVDSAPDPCCIDDRWADPPPEIGQTPPDRDAPEGALDPFRPDDPDR